MTTISEKRANETEDVYYTANVVLVDIEGTTTSIDFVKNTLFPYVRKNLEVYLKSKWNDDEFKEDLKLLQQQSKQDEADGTEGLVKIPEGFSEDISEDVKKNVLWQMDLDRKTKALKQLQGHIWRDAYKNGEVKAHVYPDVAPALKSWKQSGKDIYVYSSGSVEAQKLLFGHTVDGDLLELFSGYFDTTVGPKVEESSYANIVNSMKRKSEEVIFFTDVPKEARAAKSAGLQAVIVVREGNLPITDDKLEFPVIKSFDDIVFETSVKRRKKSEEEPLEKGKTNSAVVDVSSMQDVEMQEESTTVNTETSKATEGVSSTAMVEAEDEQSDSMKQARVKSCATNEEAKQTSCKDKDAMNSDLASTKQTGGKLVDQGSAEVKEENVTNAKTLAVNGAEKLDGGSDNSQMESNGLKCPKDNLPKSVANNIDAPIKTTGDASTNSKGTKLNENKNTCSSSEKCHDVAADNLPVTGNVDIVVPDSKTDTKLTDNDKSEINDKTEKCKHDSKICDDSSLPCGKASTKPVSSDATDSKVKVESLTDKTESTLPDAAEIASKTECTHTEKTENICTKTESTITDKSESAPICKTESLKPIDAESKKTESEANKTEPMETDDLTSGDLKNKDEPVQKDKTEVAKGVVPVNEVETDIPLTKDEDKGKAAVSSSENEESAASKTETADDSKPEAATEATPDGSKTAAEATPDDGKVEAAAEATPDVDKIEAAAEATPDSGKADAAAEATTDGGKVEATPDGSKVEAAVEATPDGGKTKAAAEATPDGAKVEAAAEATPDGGKVEVEAAVEATPDGGKVEAAAEATPNGKVEAAAEATPNGKVEAAAEATPNGKVEAAAEATPNGKVEAAVEATPNGKVEAAAEATPDGGKVEAAAEATPDGGKVEAAAEATPDGGKVEAAAEATPDGGKVEAAMEISPDDCKTEAAEEATIDGGKAEAAMEVSPDDKAVPKATSDDVKTKGAPDSGNAGTAEEVTLAGGKIEAANSMDDANVSKVTSDVKTDSVASVAEVKANNETDVPMEDAEPMVTDDPEQTPTDKAKLKVKEECEPMVTDDSEPMSTDEAKPITEGAKHSLTDDAEPMVTEGSEPMVTKENENVNSTVNDGEKPETVQPEKDTKANEKSNECTKNVPSDSTHAVDSTSCNSMNKDVAVNDTNGSAGTGKSDTAATVKDGEALETKTELSNTENKISKAEDQNVVDNVKEVKNEVKGGKNIVNSCIENGESTDKTDNTSEKLKIAAERTDKVAENAVST